MSPYRRPAVHPEEKTRAVKVACGDRDLLPIFAIFWALSVVRVAAGVARHEMFGTEATLAFLGVLLVPWLMKDACARWCVLRQRAEASRPALKKD